MEKQPFQDTNVPNTAEAASEQNHNGHCDPYQDEEYLMRFTHGV